MLKALTFLGLYFFIFVDADTVAAFLGWARVPVLSQVLSRQEPGWLSAPRASQTLPVGAHPWAALGHPSLLGLFLGAACLALGSSMPEGAGQSGDALPTPTWGNFAVAAPLPFLPLHQGAADLSLPCLRCLQQWRLSVLP